MDFPDGEMESWAVLGDVTDHSVRVWVREPSGPVRALLLVDGAQVAQAEIAPDPAHDMIGVAVLEVGSAETEHANSTVRVGGSTVRGTFRAGTRVPAAFTFAFGSCHQPFTGADGRRARRAPSGGRIYPRITQAR